ncbi:MAG: hypothetical protein ABI123_04435 [Ginsengibacter sp.]|jgi:hypothetical protein
MKDKGMKKLFTLCFLLITFFGLNAQKRAIHKRQITKEKPINYNGQWRGGFNDDTVSFSKVSSNNVGYVLELEIHNNQITGNSYSYFNLEGHKYYTICRVRGTLDPKTKEMEVVEVEKIKSNTPPPPIFSSCLQIHKLKYEKDADGSEVLRGTWIPAPNQAGNCGIGITVLSRRKMDIHPLGIKPPSKNNQKPAIVKATPKPHTPKKPIPAPPKKIIPKEQTAIAKEKAKPTVPPNNSDKKENTQKSTTVINNDPVEKEISKSGLVSPPILKGFEKRRNDIVKTIEILQPTFRLDFYDNGEIDGDSISVFYNGKLVLSHQRISDKAVTLHLALDENVKENIVTMYADNLGTIPPNTAVMIVTDGDKRYEVRLESDLKKSGSVIFLHGNK